MNGTQIKPLDWKMKEGGAQAHCSGGEAVLRFLEARAAEHVFGVPGSSSIPIFHAFPWSNRQFVSGIQENAAVAMADGYARIKGPTGVLLYMMPGVATAMSNLYNASRDETPLMVIASQQASYARWNQGSVGETELTQMVAPFARFTREATHGKQLCSLLDAAYRASSGPPGGVSLVVTPEDLLRDNVPLPRFAPRTRESTLPARLDELSARLAQAERPLIVVGGQLRRTGGSAAIEALAEEFEIPVALETFWNDRLGIAPGHRCFVSNLTEGSSLGSKADLVLAIGCRLFNEVHPRESSWFDATAFVAHVNADAEKLEQTFAVNWSCAADPGATAKTLLEAVRRHGISANLREARAARLRDAVQKRSRPRPGPYAEAAEALATEMDSAYLVDESVSGNYPLVSRLRSRHGERYVSTTGASLGWGPGAACGVALATGEPVTCVVGDGAFFFGIQALNYARTLRLPVTFVVLDNGGFGSTQWFEEQYAQSQSDAARRHTHFVGSDFRGTRPDVLEAAAGFGLRTQEATDGVALNRYLQAARGGPPSVVRLRIPSSEPTGRR